MFLRTILLLSILGWLAVDCLVPIPPIYRQAELGLNRYISSSSSNPMTYSLFNVLIHVKQAKAFIADEAIEMALEHIKAFDEETQDNIEQVLRQIIYGTNCKPNDENCLSSNQNPPTQPTAAVKHRIVAALDKFFASNKADDYWPLDTLKEKKF